MNFPDLETCKAIEGEFEGSEYLWVFRRRNSSATEPTVIRRGEFVFGDEELAKAPTCEELGAWIKNYFEPKTHLDASFEDSNEWQDSNIAWDCLFSDNETQARAEAVKKLIEYSTT